LSIKNCSNCGAPVEPDANQCEWCRSTLRQSTDPPEQTDTPIEDDHQWHNVWTQEEREAEHQWRNVWTQEEHDAATNSRKRIFKAQLIPALLMSLILINVFIFWDSILELASHVTKNPETASTTETTSAETESTPKETAILPFKDYIAQDLKTIKFGNLTFEVPKLWHSDDVPATELDDEKKYDMDTFKRNFKRNAMKISSSNGVEIRVTQMLNDSNLSRSSFGYHDDILAHYAKKLNFKLSSETTTFNTLENENFNIFSATSISDDNKTGYFFTFVANSKLVMVSVLADLKPSHIYDINKFIYNIKIKKTTAQMWLEFKRSYPLKTYDEIRKARKKGTYDNQYIRIIGFIDNISHGINKISFDFWYPSKGTYDYKYISKLKSTDDGSIPDITEFKNESEIEMIVPVSENGSLNFNKCLAVRILKNSDIN
jgi:hypothetical protein